MAFNFNYTTRTMFDDPNVENEVALTAPGAWPAGKWHIDATVRVNVFTPFGADGQQALLYVDARPSSETRMIDGTGAVSDSSARRNVRFQSVVDFTFAAPQQMWFMVAVPTGGAWVELVSISGTATEVP
jgi:hypothetical protein